MKYHLKTHKNINMPLKLQVMLQIVLIKRLLFTRVLIRHEVDESKYKLPVYSENR